MAELGKDYIIDEYGVVVHLTPGDTKNKSADDELQSELYQLEYEIFSHSDRFTADELAAKKARLADVQKQLNINKKVNVLTVGQDLLKRRMAEMRNNGQSYSDTFAQNIAAQKDRD